VVTMPVAGHQPGEPEVMMPAIGDMARFLVQDWAVDAPDVVHCHGWVYGMAAQLAANGNPLSTVQSFHGLNAPMRADRVGSTVKLEALLARNATAVAAACTDDMQELIQMG